jgi:hypothetical protein
MGKHILFLVHGMGSYGKYENGEWASDKDGWFKEATDALRGVYDEFIKDDPDLGHGEEFDTRFAVEFVEYDSYMEGYRHAWETQAGTWDAFPIEEGIAKAVAEFFKGNSDDAFFWTHVADVLLYLSPLVKDALHVHVGKQIFKALQTYHKALTLDSWSIIAHSLGSAVVSNSLQLILRDIDQDAELRVAAPSPLVVCMAANVARLLSPAAAAYNAVITPTGDFGVQRYVSCSHELDPFCRVRLFQPTDPQWTESWRYSDLNELSDYYLLAELADWAIDRENFDKAVAIVPHQFRHYMRQPKVVAQLWPLLLSKEPVDFQDLEEKVREKNLAKVLEVITAPKLEEIRKRVEETLKAALNAVGQPSDVKAAVANALPKILHKLEGLA